MCAGWPSFSDVASQGKVTKIADKSFGMLRVEVVCANVRTTQTFVLLLYISALTSVVPTWDMCLMMVLDRLMKDIVSILVHLNLTNKRNEIMHNTLISIRALYISVNRVESALLFVFLYTIYGLTNGTESSWPKGSTRSLSNFGIFVGCTSTIRRFIL